MIFNMPSIGSAAKVSLGGYVGNGAKITINDNKTGAYSGTGRKITLGFEPDLIILIEGDIGWQTPAVHFKRERLFNGLLYLDIFDWNTYRTTDGGASTTYVPVKIESDGFRVADVWHDSKAYITANKNGAYYFYAALKFGNEAVHITAE